MDECVLELYVQYWIVSKIDRSDNEIISTKFMKSKWTCIEIDEMNSKPLFLILHFHDEHFEFIVLNGICWKVICKLAKYWNSSKGPIRSIHMSTNRWRSLNIYRVFDIASTCNHMLSNNLTIEKGNFEKMNALMNIESFSAWFDEKLIDL